ncbi:hypothetical protein [Celeribacter baekdonensis]|uniref:hypothetical protein n=1 Tax=Celeribacter baekdonensis TaxID=875171 RepID=UPI0030D90E04|tara:strand:- start:255508 stop:255786 length:279 start_codon:yes stop_codon:yes gene_type:complete
MRRGSFADLPFTKTERQERQAAPVPDGPVTRVGGRDYLQETSRHDARNTALTPAEQKVLKQRRLEAAERRHAESEANLAAALRLGAALKGGG